MKQTSMNLLICINQKYVRYAYVMLTSFLENNTQPLFVYVLYRDLTDDGRQALCQLSNAHSIDFHFIYVPDHLLPPARVLATSSWGLEAYFRLAATDLLPDSLERILYLDTDIIVNGPLNGLYFCDMQGNKIAACKEFTSTPPFDSYRDELFAPLFSDNFFYFNSGMILYDLNAMRPHYSFRTYMELAKFLNYKIQFPDQDLLNYCHHNETLFVDTLRYNLHARYAYTHYSMHYEDIKEHAAVVHYASSKPWRSNFVHCEVEQLWWDYAKKTPFFIELLRETINETLTDNTVNSYIADLLAQNQKLYARIEHYEQLLKDAGIQL